MSTRQTQNNRRITRHKHAGVTLVELAVVMATVALLSCAVLAISLQFSRINQRTNAVLVPQSIQIYALKRMERELREMYHLELTSTTTSLEFTPPKKTIGTVKVIDPQQSSDNSITPMPDGYTVRYFLGTLNGSAATPSATGDTVFRVDSTTPKDSAGNYTLTNPDKYIVMRNFALTQGLLLFSYEPGGNTPVQGTRLVTVTLGSPVRETMASAITYQCLSTQFALRNIQGL